MSIRVMRTRFVRSDSVPLLLASLGYSVDRARVHFRLAPWKQRRPMIASAWQS
jgi:hypothetical protein